MSRTHGLRYRLLVSAPAVVAAAKMPPAAVAANNVRRVTPSTTFTPLNTSQISPGLRGPVIVVMQDMRLPSVDIDNCLFNVQCTRSDSRTPSPSICGALDKRIQKLIDVTAPRVSFCLLRDDRPLKVIALVPSADVELVGSSLKGDQ
jgi:hypothetical protein